MIDAVCGELREIFRDYRLLNKSGVIQEVRVFPQYIPQPAGITFADQEQSGLEHYGESDYEANFPGIVVKLGDMTDNEEGRIDHSRAGLRLLFGVYDDTAESGGWRDVLAMMEKVRQKWLSERLIARKFFVRMPLTARLLEADTYPVYFGEMLAELETGRTSRPMDFVYRGYIGNG